MLCVERLSYLINEVLDKKHWHPIIPCRVGPALSHLFFADDLVLMGKANVTTARTIRNILDKFCHASGLKLNLEKSKVFFSKAGGHNFKRSISRILGFGQTANLGKYLGVHLTHGRVEIRVYAETFDRILAKMSGWKTKFLSLAGRTTLIQSVSSAIPIYSMQSNWLPEYVYDKLDRMNRDFLWSNDVDKKKMHLVSWQKVTLPKDKGGLGVRTARGSNEALLSKLVWKILRKENTVWQQLVQAKYLKAGNVLQYQVKPGDSATWKGIIRCVGLIKPFLRWRIGDGQSISFWYDNWLGDGAIREKDVHPVPAENRMTLADMVGENGEWLISNLQTHIPQVVLDKIMEFDIQLSDSDDLILWNETGSGTFTCQTAYRAIQEKYGVTQPVTKNWSWIWKSKFSNKLKHFLWLAQQGRLATNHLRKSRRLSETAACPRCNAEDETVTHTLRDCPYALQTWRKLLPADQLGKFLAIPEGNWLERNVSSESFTSTKIQ